MFSGIVTGYDKIVSVEDKNNVRRIVLELSDYEGLEQGASVAINGVCLTAVDIQGPMVGFDVIQETLGLTNLNGFQPGDRVNTERSFKHGQELGGHIVSGHVDSSVEVLSTEIDLGAVKVWFSLPESLSKYVLPKGFIALDGCSLTVVDVVQDRFSVCFIPETLTVTTHGNKAVGRVVNLEVDRQTQAIVDTVERIMAQRYALGATE